MLAKRFYRIWERKLIKRTLRCDGLVNLVFNYYMAESVSREGETNPAFWLANQAGSGFLALFPKKMLSYWPYNNILKSSIYQAYSIKMAVYWPRLGP